MVLFAELLSVELLLVEFPFVELLVVVLLLGSWTTVPTSLLLTVAPAVWVILLIVLLGVDAVDGVADDELLLLLPFSIWVAAEITFELELGLDACVLNRFVLEGEFEVVELVELPFDNEPLFDDDGTVADVVEAV